MRPRQRLVIAGGIGSGKSLVVAGLSELGWSTINADRVGHEVLADPDVLDEVASRWPEAVISGAVNRPALAAIVFYDQYELLVLESITHPVIANRVHAWAEASPEPRAIEVSVLKAARREWGDILIVHSPSQLRLRRAVERGMDPADAKARMDVQPKDSEWLAAADVVIDNQGTLSELMELVAQLDRWARP